VIPELDVPAGLVGTHLWIVNPVKDPSEGGRGWFDTHPATADRIARLRALTGQGAGRDTEAAAAPAG